MNNRIKPEVLAKALVLDFEMIIEQHCNQSSRDAHLSAAKECARLHVTNIKTILLPPGARNGTERAEELFWDAVLETIETL